MFRSGSTYRFPHLKVVGWFTPYSDDFGKGQNHYRIRDNRKQKVSLYRPGWKERVTLIHDSFPTSTLLLKWTCPKTRRLQSHPSYRSTENTCVTFCHSAPTWEWTRNLVTWGFSSTLFETGLLLPIMSPSRGIRRDWTSFVWRKRELVGRASTGRRSKISLLVESEGLSQREQPTPGTRCWTYPTIPNLVHQCFLRIESRDGPGGREPGPERNRCRDVFHPG